MRTKNINIKHSARHFYLTNVDKRIQRLDTR